MGPELIRTTGSSSDGSNVSTVSDAHPIPLHTDSSIRQTWYNKAHKTYKSRRGLVSYRYSALPGGPSYLFVTFDTLTHTTKPPFESLESLESFIHRLDPTRLQHLHLTVDGRVRALPILYLLSLTLLLYSQLLSARLRIMRNTHLNIVDRQRSRLLQTL